MKIPDPYAELGLMSGASDVEIKRAYRRLVSHWHPDRNTSSEALEKMKRLNRAYQLLTERGAHFGDGGQAPGSHRWPPGAEPFGDAEDFARHFRDGFGAGFGAGNGRAGAGGRRRRSGAGTAWNDDWFRGDDWVAVDDPSEPKTVRRKVSITLEEAAHGCTRSVSGSTIDLCAQCGGTRMFKAMWASCPTCDGEGRVHDDDTYRRIKCRDCRGDGSAHRACSACGGTGKCASERAWKLEVRIPAGVLPGDVVTARGQGQRGAGDARGDLELEIAIKPHALFSFDAQRRLQCMVPVDLFKFLVGGVIEVPTLGGASVIFDLARGRVQEIDGKGYPGRDRVRGPLVLVALPVFPRTLSDREALYLRSLANDLEQDGHARCAEVATWLAAARAYREPAAAAKASRPRARSAGGTRR